MPIKKWQVKMAKAVIVLLILCACGLLSSTVQAQTLIACENNKTHKVSFPPVGKSCKSDETAITLAGPGPTGPTGPTGPPGSSGGPSLELEGTGALVPTSPTCGPDGLCPGDLTASLTGPPFQQLSLDMSVSVSQTASPDSCYLTTGFTSIGSGSNQSEASFEGKLCVTFFTYLLKGTLTTMPVSSCQTPFMVSAGELIAYGAVHTSGPTPTPGPSPGNPIPVNQGANPDAIISIIGSTGQIPAPCPSP